MRVVEYAYRLFGAYMLYKFRVHFGAPLLMHLSLAHRRTVECRFCLQVIHMKPARAINHIAE